MEGMQIETEERIADGVQVIVPPNGEIQIPLFPKEERIRNLEIDVPWQRREGLRLLQHVGESAKFFKSLAGFAEHLDAVSEYEAISKNTEIALDKAQILVGDLCSARECFEKAAELEQELADLRTLRADFHNVPRKTDEE